MNLEFKIMYGEGMFYIKDIDIWKNKLRLIVANEFEKDRFIFMKTTQAQELVNEIWAIVEKYRNEEILKVW